ncbi:DNA translocase FtsK [Segnochrobactrum spirostomi]|uniref:DNA translocase FtsK n=1 Tax=Segnochrobactrum spirostomi TaxID=2608987 RepID=A0A6A7Y032_9HYPH|nr:DNA translocase FtsK [Segnochrobactrum spirostomi]MQT12203.1 DNA translocase FtsK [Segnochrobactrum spirostomi]
MPAVRTTRYREDDEGGLVTFARRNLASIGGFALFCGIVAVIAALATWSVSDASLSHAVDGPIHNVLGFAGASVSDFLIQMFGIGVAILLIGPTFWAVRLMRGRPSRVRRWRLVAWGAAVLLASAALSALNPPATWPLPTGLGGAVGDMVFAGPRTVLKALLGASDAGVGIALLLPTVLVLLFGLGYPKPSERKPAPPPKREMTGGIKVRSANRAIPEDFEEDDARPGRAAMVLGTLTHWAYLTGARVRQFAEKHRRPEDDPFADELGIETDDVATPQAASRRERAEPRFGLGAAMAAADERLEPGFDTTRSSRFEMLPDDDTAEADPFDAPFPEDEEPPFDYGPDEPIPDTFREIDGAPPKPVAAPVLRRADARPAPAAAMPPAAMSARVAAPAPPPKPGRRLGREQQPSLLDPHTFEMPPLRLLAEPKAAAKSPAIDKAALENNARALEGVLEDFGVRGQIVNVRPGPVVTLYELEPAPGIKSSRVIGLADDIARSMSAISARVAVIPGKNAIGIELPNVKRETVFLRELAASADFEQSKQRLALCLGKNIGGEPVIVDLARMPHLLVAGTTGSGKSVAINTMILSLLYRMTPQQCRLIMVDPKMLELSVYDGIPHLLTPVVTDPKKAVVALKWTVREMEERYRKMSKLGVRNVDGFNARVAEAKEKGENLTRIVQTGFDRQTGEPVFEEEEIAQDLMPYIVVIVDEMADLMMVAGKDIEGAIQRLAQMARAAGIHLIMATQRPSVDVITGTIKANFPTRISFQVTSKIDSRTILGEQGAEQLLGQGDMLYMAGGGRIQRVHGPFVSDNEVEAVVAHLKAQGAPDYLEHITADDEDGGEAGGDSGGGGGGYDGLEESADLYDQAVAVVLRDRKASTSYVQRRLQIGYNRAASIIERMEREGIVGPANHAGKREILVGGDDSAAA